MIHNKEIYRQNYAIRDFAFTLANTINMNDLQSKDTAYNELKTALNKSFFIKERNLLDPEYKAPDDKSRKNEESARAVEEYMNNYKKEPWYIG